MKTGIKLKFGVLLSTLLFLATSAIGVFMIVHQRASLEAQLRSMAGTITDEFAEDSKMPLLQKDALAMNLISQNIQSYPGVSEAYILDDEFVIQGHKLPEKVGRTASEAKGLSAGLSGDGPWLIKEEGGTFTFLSPIVFKKTTVGYTVASFSDAFIKKQVGGAVRKVVAIASFLVVAVSLLSIPIATRLLRPIFTLLKGTREIAKGNFEYRIPESGADEIGDLVRSFNAMASELKKKEVLTGVFNRYVSPAVADEILKEPERIVLGGERRDVTVFFVDIRDFTALSRRMPPERIVDILNRHFTLVTGIVFHFEGTIDKFIGDAVMSVFGAPIRTGRHLEQGIKAALAIKYAYERLRTESGSDGAASLEMGIGLDTGEVIVGNIGTHSRMEYTAMGDAVNLASRLAGVAKAGEILITGAAYRSVSEHVVAEKMRTAEIKGIKGPFEMYNVVDLKGRWKEEAARAMADSIPGLQARSQESGDAKPA